MNTQKKHLPALAAALASALLAGCAGTGGIHPVAVMRGAASVPSAASIAALSVGSAPWPADAWWSRYGDPQLTALVTQALADSPSMRVAQARVRQAAAQEGLAEAARLPSVGAAARSTRQHFSANSNVPKPLAGNWAWFNDASVTFSYELDFWGKNSAALEAAVGRVKAAEADAAGARLLLAVALTQGYFTLDRLYALRDLAVTTLAQRQQILALARQRTAAGLDSELDQKQAELAIPVAREQVAALDEALALVRGQLAALAGHGPDQGLAIARPKLALPQAPGVPGQLASGLLARRPDLVALRWRAEASGHDIRVARAQFYPSINLVALVGLQSLGFDRLLRAGSRTGGAGPVLSLPLFDGGRLRSNLGARSAAYDAAAEQYNQGVADAARDVVAQLTSISWLGERMHQQELAVGAATQAWQMAGQRYRAGLGNYLQVLVADGQLLAQQRNRIELQARAYDLDLNLVRSLGGGYSDSPATHRTASN